jgi:hypothetical protein
MNCEHEERALAYVAGDLSALERASFLAHARGCKRCTGVSQMSGALNQPAAPVPALVDAVLARTQRRPLRSWVPLAASLLVVVSASAWWRSSGPTVQARGEVLAWHQRAGVELRPLNAVARQLSEGSRVPVAERWALWYRNTETDQPLFVLAYVLDAQGELHWVAPGYVSAGQEPAAVLLPVSNGGQLMSEVTELETPAAGSALAVTLLSRAPLSVLALEAAPAETRRNPEVLWPQVSVRKVKITLGE